MKKLYLAIIIFFISACSRLELATNWADTYITHQIDDYFDINSIQSSFLKKSLKEDIQKIRVRIFPQVASEMQKILKEVDEQTKFNQEIVSVHEVEFKKIFYDGLKIFEASAVEFSSQLDADQLSKFKKEFGEKTKDLQKEVDRPYKAKEKRFDKIKKQIESWIGNLNNDQKRDVEKFCQLNLFPLREQILNRDKLSREFIESFPDMNKRKEYVHELFLNYESLREPIYTKAVLNDQKNFFELLATILNKLTPEQRKHLNEILRDRIKQLNDVAQKKRDL